LSKGDKLSEQIKKSSNSSFPIDSDQEVVFNAPDTKDIDSVLEEIDAVLEKNAEEFVKGFIQKGGQ
jgi:ubiquitin-like protein Pup